MAKSVPGIIRDSGIYDLEDLREERIRTPRAASCSTGSIRAHPAVQRQRSEGPLLALADIPGLVQAGE